MTALDDLIERLEKATGPTRELFEAAYVAINGEVDWWIEGNWQPFYRFLALLKAEAWLDAAMSLVPEGWLVADCVQLSKSHWVWTLAVEKTDNIKQGASEFGSALALVISALKARKESA